jgi:alanyl-tRNA synthetase
MQAAAKRAGVDANKTEIQPSLRIVADHSRAATFLISDGVTPANDGRGYVLRKIIRRALRHVEKLNADSPRPFLSFMAGEVRANMRGAYPELEETSRRVDAVLNAEESRFSHTVDVGLKHLLDDIAPLGQPKPGEPAPVYAGEKAFRLYDTFGLPRDFIEDVCRDAGITVDWAGFDSAMKEQRTRARASWKGAHKDVANPVFAKLAETFKTEPDFYFGSSGRDSLVEAIITKNGSVQEIAAGTEAEIVLDRSSIYSESGGQVADTGKLYDNAESIELATVRGAYYPVAGLIAHRVVATDTIRVGDRVATVADGARREHIKRNHTATHLMNAALRNILGTHVKQAGSLVEPGRLRFDFSHFAPVDAAELKDIEQQVNEEILLNNELETNIMAIDEALASGALAFFGDRYPESNVRVVTIPDATSPRGFFSKELCGGTHVKRSGDIGIFKIIGESSVAAGVRRIEAISGVRALEEYQRAADSLRSIAATMNVSPEEIEATTQKLIEGRRELEKQLNTVQKKSAQRSADELIAKAREVKGVKVVAARVPDMTREALRGLVDTLKQKLGSGVIALGMVEDEKVALIVGVTKDLTAKCNAGKIIQAIAKEVGGSGGGRPDLAEAGGKDTAALNMALDTVPAILDRML